MKVCAECGEAKAEGAFRLFASGALSGKCKTCLSRGVQAWQRANPHKHKVNKARYAAGRRQRAREVIDQAKDRPCADCGGSYPTFVMQFDHVRGRKLFMLSRPSSVGYSLTRIQEEIDKCEIVCANCHAIRTHA